MKRPKARVVETAMNRSWLVQRLERPFTGTSIFGADNPFSFGGGLRNGGLSNDAMGLLRGVFSFEYMGSAEFEFGAVPEALSGLAKDAKHLTAFVVQVPLSTVPPNWRLRGKDVPPTGDAPVYVLCRKAHADEVRTRVLAWAAGSEGLKEHVGLSSSLRPHDEWDGRTAGWLELDNGFFFFTDAAMWTATADLFGVRAAVLS